MSEAELRKDIGYRVQGELKPGGISRLLCYRLSLSINSRTMMDSKLYTIA